MPESSRSQTQAILQGAYKLHPHNVRILRHAFHVILTHLTDLTHLIRADALNPKQIKLLQFWRKPVIIKLFLKGFWNKGVLIRQGLEKEGVEIVFVSSDVSEEEMMEYFRSLGIAWAVEFGSRYHRHRWLENLYGVNWNEDEAMVVFDKDGNTVTTNGRERSDPYYSPAVTPVRRDYWLPYGQTPPPIPSPLAEEHQDMMNETSGPAPKIVEMLWLLQHS